MAAPNYPTAPVKTTGMPGGIPFIIGNEAAERFCFYGMNTILTVFMTQYLLGANGQLAVMQPEQAKSWFHLFVSAVYFLPFFGAVVADAFWGKFPVIVSLSIVYCLGSITLALDQTRLGLFGGLALIAIGSGGIKPCVSALVGDQFGPSNQHLISRVFGWFYFAINFGSFFSTLLTPWLLVKFGPRVAFGVPGLFMITATIVIWMGRRRFVRIPPTGTAFVRDVFSRTGLQTILKLSGIYVFVAMFWALWNQTGSSWVLQAQKMDCHFLGINWLPSQIQALNPLMILLFIPVFSYWIYPALNRLFVLTPLRKIGIGLFLTVPTFLIPAWLESRIALGENPSIGWQFLDYAILTGAEIMVSITCLEFSYTQAPKKMKSFMMSLYLLAISLGNAFTAGINYFIQNPDGSSKLSGPNYYLFFAGAMFLTAVLFVFAAILYKEKTYIQDEAVETVEKITAA